MNGKGVGVAVGVGAAVGSRVNVGVGARVSVATGAINVGAGDAIGVGVIGGGSFWASTRFGVAVGVGAGCSEASVTAGDCAQLDRSAIESTSNATKLARLINETHQSLTDPEPPISRSAFLWA